MEKQFINPEGLVKPGVYTPAISVSGGKTIYISGQVSQDAAGKLVGNEKLEQKGKAQKILGEAQAKFGDVKTDVKETVTKA